MKKFSKNIQDDNKLLKNDTKNIHNRQSMMLKMVTSYSVFLLIILILYLYLHVSAFKNAQNQYEWQVKSTLMSNVELFEKDLSIMEAYCRQLLQNNQFKKLAKADENSEKFWELGYSICTTMATDGYPEALLPVSEIYCYLPNSGYVVGSTYFVAQNQYYDQIKRFSKEAYEKWVKALTSSSAYYHFIEMNDFMQDNSQSSYMYIINANDLLYIDIDAIVCFIMDKTELSSLFECMSTDTDYHYLSVQTLEGETILSLSSDEDRRQETTYDVYTYQSDNYIYCYSYPSFAVDTNFAHPQILYATFFVAAIAGGLMLVFTISKRNIKPILELDQQLKATEQEKSSLLEEKSHLQKVMDNQRPIIFNSYVRQLLKGLIVSEQEAIYAKEFLGLTDSNLIFNGLYIVAYNNVNDEQKTLYTTEEYNQAVMETLKLYTGGGHLYCFSPSDRTYAMIVAGHPDDETDLITKSNEMINKVHDILLEKYGIWLFAGIGKNTDDIVNVWESYQQAGEAINYTGKNVIFFPYEKIKKDSNAFYYPVELSTKLIHFITTGNTPQVLELFSLLHQENIEERSLPINMVQFLLSDIRNTLLKARFTLPQNMPKDALKILDEQFNQHVSFKLCEDIALKLCQFFNVKSDDSDIISAIERYIRENFSDPSMGLNKISDEFQISESYFSHMFKEKTGVNFSTYLETIRLNEASRLIRETDISLNELYLSVGYNNANSFRRAFKKIYGITPSAMRDSKTNKL